VVDDSDARLTRDEIAQLRRVIWKLSKLTTERDHAQKRPIADERDVEPGEITLYCSFCGCSQHEVTQLIAGPSVYICDACVSLCVEI
jgi:hypothetical protein